MRLFSIVCALLIVCLASTSPTSAAVPSLVNYSGVLTDAGGTPLSGTFSVVFRIYATSAPAFPLWGETQSVTTDGSGRFNVLLGTVLPLSASAFAAEERWLGITVEGDAEMTPRMRIATAPYAFRPSTVDGADGGEIVGSLSCGHNQTLGGASNFLAGDSNTADGSAASVTAGINNTATGPYSIIGGGRNNEIDGQEGGILSGSDNYASGLASVVVGGSSNRVTGASSVIPGGYANRAAGDYSFAGGHDAKASHDRTFVWNGSASFTPADSQRSVGPGSVTMRASGGYHFFSSTGVSTTGAELAAGSGTWASMSDRDSKENIEPVDADELLALLSLIPIAKWNYITQDDAIRHIGPMAQDFYAAFGVGEDDKHITTIDADGVALAAIQALLERVKELEEKIAEMEKK